jgi:hypothetical protein
MSTAFICTIRDRRDQPVHSFIATSKLLADSHAGSWVGMHVTYSNEDREPHERELRDDDFSWATSELEFLNDADL